MFVGDPTVVLVKRQNLSLSTSEVLARLQHLDRVVR